MCVLGTGEISKTLSRDSTESERAGPAIVCGAMGSPSPTWGFSVEVHDAPPGFTPL